MDPDQPTRRGMRGRAAGTTAVALMAALVGGGVVAVVEKTNGGSSALTTVTPAEVADAFLKANPSLKADDIAVTCDRKRLTEIRVCMSKEFGFRACPEVTQRACRLDKVVMPALRGS